MKKLMIFLLFGTTSLMLSQPINLDIDFVYNNIKPNSSNHQVHLKSTIVINESDFGTVECGTEANVVLHFYVADKGGKEVKIETHIIENNILLAKPSMVVPYNQRGIIELGEAVVSHHPRKKLNLSIIPSKEVTEDKV